MSRIAFLTAFMGAASALGLGGCVNIATLTYRPLPMPPQPTVGAVQLMVLDEREPKLGGDNHALLGNLRAGFGNPFSVQEADAGRVAAIVHAGTADTLARVGIVVHPNAARVLVAHIRR